MLDWLGRTLLLVLSGLASFALMAAVMSATQTAMPGARSVATGDLPRAAPSTAAGEAGEWVAVDAPTASAPTRDVAHWLEALTWAVLALAGFAAAGLLALLRITWHLGRIAERQ